MSLMIRAKVGDWAVGLYEAAVDEPPEEGDVIEVRPSLSHPWLAVTVTKRLVDREPPLGFLFLLDLTQQE